MSEPRPSGTVNLTPARALVVAALFGGLVGWVVAAAAEAFDLVAPPVPWTAPVGLMLIVALVGALAYSTRQRIHVRRQRMEPQRAVAFLVLGKASALAGALVGGVYFGFALRYLTRLDAPGPRERVVASAVCVVAGIALCGAGLLLERACRVPRDDDADDPGSDTAG